MMFSHDLHLSHTRHPLADTFETHEASSSISITADSIDLVEAFMELLTRLPPELHVALEAAMKRRGMNTTTYTISTGEGGAGGLGFPTR